MNTTAIGIIAEAQVLAALLRSGKVVLVPFGGGQRYDFVIDNGDEFQRVQCKSGRLRNGCVLVKGRSATLTTKGMKQRGYRGEADFFGVYCVGTEKCYLVPVGEVPESEFRIRVEATRNNQDTGVRYAKDYEI